MRPGRLREQVPRSEHLLATLCGLRVAVLGDPLHRSRQAVAEHHLGAAPSSGGHRLAAWSDPGVIPVRYGSLVPRPLDVRADGPGPAGQQQQTVPLTDVPVSCEALVVLVVMCVFVVLFLQE